MRLGTHVLMPYTSTTHLAFLKVYEGGQAKKWQQRSLLIHDSLWNASPFAVGEDYLA